MPKFSPGPVRAAFSPASRSTAPRCATTSTKTRRCMASAGRANRSSAAARNRPPWPISSWPRSTSTPRAGTTKVGQTIGLCRLPASAKMAHKMRWSAPLYWSSVPMSTPFQIAVCGSIVPDPLQTLEPVIGPAGPSLKNEMMLPAVLDPWAGHALFEAAHLARSTPGSKVWLVSLGPKAKLQQVMMTVAQKVPFELVALDGPASGFTDSFETAAALAAVIAAIPGLDRSNLLVFGGWESASRGAGSTLQMVGERLGIAEQFQGVDQVTVGEDGSLEILERIEGGRHQVSVCAGPPAVLGWATGNLPEPRNNPQIGMANMRAIMPALQRAKATPIPNTGLSFHSVNLPRQQRETRIVKDMPAEEIAREIVAWMAEE